MRQATPQLHHGAADLVTQRDMALMVMHGRGRAAMGARVHPTRRRVVVSAEQAAARARGPCGGGRRRAHGVAVVARAPEVDSAAAGSGGGGGVGCAGGVAVAVMHLGFLCVVLFCKLRLFCG